MSQLVKFYGDLVQADTTHGTTCYSYKAMLPAGVDCFNETVIFDCKLMIAETTKAVSAGLNDFGLSNVETLITDGGACFPSVAHELKACFWQSQ